MANTLPSLLLVKISSLCAVLIPLNRHRCPVLRYDLCLGRLAVQLSSASPSWSKLTVLRVTLPPTFSKPCHLADLRHEPRGDRDEEVVRNVTHATSSSTSTMYWTVVELVFATRISASRSSSGLRIPRPAARPRSTRRADNPSCKVAQMDLSGLRAVRDVSDWIVREVPLESLWVQQWLWAPACENGVDRRR